MKSYAGIGSREISDLERELIKKIAGIMHEKGYLLYSGGAPGSDIAFESGCNGYGVSFRPWTGFGENSEAVQVIHHSKDSHESVSNFHPAPDALSPAARKLMSRNYHQIHGIEPYFPKVDLVICCANEKKGAVQGGDGAGRQNCTICRNSSDQH